MPFRLREQLHWCNCGGCVVFLDVRSGRYFCLAGASNEAFLRLSIDGIEPGDCEHLKLLVDRGLLVADDAVAIPPPASLAEPARTDLLSGTPMRPRLHQLLRAIAAELRFAWLLRSRPFIAILEAAGGDIRSPPRDAMRCAREIAAASATAALLTGATDRCLVRALAVHSTCRSHGLRSSLVFGIRMNPFAAHCWVQFGAAVLVGEFEQVRLYTPIMVIE